MSLVPGDIPLLLRSLQHQNCIAAIPLIFKKRLLLRRRGDNREFLWFLSQFFSFTISHQVCLPDQNNPFIPGIKQGEGKAWLSCRHFMQRSQPAEIWEIINCREMDSGRKMVDSQRFLIDRCINISTALSTIGSGKPKACNNSYTVRWTKVQKVIRNEIKVSTGYKTSIQMRSRKIIEMIVRL